MRRIGAKIDLMMTPRNGERLRQFPWTGAEPPNIFDFSSQSHARKTAPRLDRPNENQSIPRPAFGEHIQHPVHAVVEIDVGRARLVSLDKRARARTLESVTGLVALDQVRFRLDHNTRAFSPNELRADQVLGALQRIALKESIGQHAATLAAPLDDGIG